jgi:hypothetical protein
LEIWRFENGGIDNLIFISKSPNLQISFLMNKKDKNDKHGFVYSTDPNFRFQNEEEAAAETLPPQQQKMRIRMDNQHRGGKTATIIANFTGREEDLEDLGKITERTIVVPVGRLRTGKSLSRETIGKSCCSGSGKTATPISK